MLGPAVSSCPVDFGIHPFPVAEGASAGALPVGADGAALGRKGPSTGLFSHVHPCSEEAPPVERSFLSSEYLLGQDTVAFIEAEVAAAGWEEQGRRPDTLALISCPPALITASYRERSHRHVLEFHSVTPIFDEANMLHKAFCGEWSTIYPIRQVASAYGYGNVAARCDYMVSSIVASEEGDCMYHVGSRMFAHQTRSVAASPYDNELALSLYGGGGLLLLNDFLEETLKVAADLESLSYGHSRNLIVGTQSHSVAIVDVRGATGSGYLACSLADRPTTLAMSRQDDFYIAAGSSEGSVHMLDMRMFNKPTATISPTVLGIRRISQIVCCSPELLYILGGEPNSLVQIAGQWSGRPRVAATTFGGVGCTGVAYAHEQGRLYAHTGDGALHAFIDGDLSQSGPFTGSALEASGEDGGIASNWYNKESGLDAFQKIYTARGSTGEEAAATLLPFAQSPVAAFLERHWADA